jgi:hypothetical protein
LIRNFNNAYFFKKIRHELYHLLRKKKKLQLKVHVAKPGQPRGRTEAQKNKRQPHTRSKEENKGGSSWNQSTGGRLRPQWLRVGGLFTRDPGITPTSEIAETLRESGSAQTDSNPTTARTDDQQAGQKELK